VKRRPFIASLGATLAGKRLAEAVARRLDATMVGGHHLPRSGAALIVGNHSFLGVDSGPLASLVLLACGRFPRFLGERNLWRLPGLAQALTAVGAIPGERGRAEALLREGELVAVYPGGVDDSFKLSRDAYVLKWGERAGFASVALGAGVPIIPIAATGIDELFAIERKETVIGRRLLGSARYDVPMPDTLLPRRVPLVYHVLPPIAPEGDAKDPAAVARLRAQTASALESVLAPYRASRGFT
jgi:1-acyl-sn-glycerol-3-phosphate acyltransferase